LGKPIKKLTSLLPKKLTGTVW